MEKRYETRSGDLFVRSWARVRRVSLDRRSSAVAAAFFLLFRLLYLSLSTATYFYYKRFTNEVNFR